MGIPFGNLTNQALATESGGTGGMWFVRGFAPITADIESVTFRNGQFGYTGRLVALIYADSAGVPSGTALAVSNEFNGTVAANASQTLTFPPGVQLTANTAYWICLHTEGSLGVADGANTTATYRWATRTYSTSNAAPPTTSQFSSEVLIFAEVVGTDANRRLSQLRQAALSTIRTPALTPTHLTQARQMILRTVGTAALVDTFLTQNRQLILRSARDRRDRGPIVCAIPNDWNPDVPRPVPLNTPYE